MLRSWYLPDMVRFRPYYTDLPYGSDGKASACNAVDRGLIPGSGRSPRERNGNLLQYSCLENPMDRGTWWATVCGVTESDTTEQLTLTLHTDINQLLRKSIFPIFLS